MENEKQSFQKYLEKRQEVDEIKFYSNPIIQKSYYIGAYARAVITSSYYSEISKKNTTFKTWLSNQIINNRNLDRIFEMAFRYEQKLKLNIRNGSEVRQLAHEVQTSKKTGISSAKISYAFVAGYDDYKKFMKENKTEKEEGESNE